MSPSAGPQAWFRNPMVWLLIAIPATSVAVGVALLVTSFRAFDGVVVDDYYERGKAINRVLARDAAAARRGLSASLALDGLTGRAELRLTALDPAALPERARLSLLHATRAGLDRVTEVRRGLDGLYRGVLPPLAPGRHHVQLEADDWRLVGALRAPAESSCALAPAR